jgi:V/A-type H+/Na+-transporting ATPase subunit E
MPTNIESFVETLKTEGVDAGKQAANQIKEKAKEQANQIVAEAQEQSSRIIADAEAEAKKMQERMQSSLELAARDALLMLQEKLSQLLNALLTRESERQLSDEETLASVMREIILAYAKTSAAGTVSAEIRVPQETQSRLITGALRELTRALKSQEIQADVKSSLPKAGFEYKVQGATVEVSAESVTALLMDLIDPELQQFLSGSMTNQTKEQ